MSKTAHILAIATSSLGDLGFGISSHYGDIEHIFEGEAWFGPRPVLETNTDFVQPIPYILVRDGDRYLTYRRAGGGEDRLRDKFAIGFGGHIDLADAMTDDAGVVILMETLLAALTRELDEELGLTLVSTNEIVFTHVIQSAATPVDQVHIGLVCEVDLAAYPQFRARLEAGIEDAEFLTIAELLDGTRTLETWTALVAQEIARR